MRASAWHLALLGSSAGVMAAARERPAATGSRTRMPVALFKVGFRTSAGDDFATNEIFHAACDFTPEREEPTDTVTAVAACTRYSEGAEAAQILRKDLGPKAVKTALNHRGIGVTCFVVTAPAAYATSLLRRPHSKMLGFAEPFPRSHTAAASLVDRAAELDGLVVHVVPGYLSKMKSADDLENASASAALDKTDSIERDAFTELQERWTNDLKQLTSDRLSKLIYWTSDKANSARRRLETAAGEATASEKSAAAKDAHQNKVEAWERMVKDLEADVKNAKVTRNGGGGDEEAAEAEDTDKNSAENVSVFGACNWSELTFEHGRHDVVIVRGVRKAESPPNNAEKNSEKNSGACTAALAGFLSAQAEVLHVAAWERPRLSNHVSVGHVQGGATGSSAVHDYGITGSGQIAGMIDSGIDELSCFFYDTSNGLVTRSGKNNAVTDLSQRKIVQYISSSDSTDTWHGHGTHTAGTLAGSIYSTWTSNSCSSKTVETCFGECDSDAMCYADSAIDSSDCAVAASDAQFQWPFYCATYTCGNVGSVPCLPDADTLLPESQGAAPDAQIAFFDAIAGASDSLDVPSEYSKSFGLAYTAGARVHSNSWGVSQSECGYEDLSLAADEYIYENTDFLLVFAAGNDGANGPCSLTAPGLSKNVLTVGATGSGTTRLDFTYGLDEVAGFSSYGPTYDYRYKPDVVAPGYFTLSSAASYTGLTQTCAVTALAGTSMATPAVAGAAVLVRQYFVDDFYTTDMTALGLCGTGLHDCTSPITSPSAALLKATVINSAQDISDGLDAPNVYEGYGSVELNSTLSLGETTLIFFAYEGSLVSDAKKEFSLDLSGLSGSWTNDLKITLVWTDPPASVTSAQQVLHDLDLLVLEPDCTLVYANGFSGTDTWNNVEKTLIAADSLTADKYTVIVQANSLTESSSQAFSLVISAPAPAIVRDPTVDTTYATTCTYTTTPMDVSSINFDLPTKVCFDAAAYLNVTSTTTEQCCVYTKASVGDGLCDSTTYNSEACYWDGGDCCSTSCEADTGFCGYNGYDCLDPAWADCQYASYAGIGDGSCDSAANNAACAYDAGDCCADCCQPVYYAAREGLLSYSCGSEGYTQCIDSACTYGKSAAYLRTTTGSLWLSLAAATGLVFTFSTV